MMKPLAFNGLRQNVKKRSPIFLIFFLYFVTDKCGKSITYLTLIYESDKEKLPYRR